MGEPGLHMQADRTGRNPGMFFAGRRPFASSQQSDPSLSVIRRCQRRIPKEEHRSAQAYAGCLQQDIVWVIGGDGKGQRRMRTDTEAGVPAGIATIAVTRGDWLEHPETSSAPSPEHRTIPAGMASPTGTLGPRDLHRSRELPCSGQRNRSTLVLYSTGRCRRPGPASARGIRDE